MSEQRNPWTERFWSLTAQGQFLVTNGLAKAQAAALEAGYVEEDFPKLGLAEEQPKSGAPSLLSAFTKEAGEQFEKTVAAHKPPAPQEWPNYSAFMGRKRAQRP